MSRPAYAILHRPAPYDESHGWTTVATPRTLGEARDVLASPTWLLAHGDLVRVVGAKRDDLYVYDGVTERLVAAPKPFALAWWEGDAADAVEMLRACERVDRRRLVLVACACARTRLHLVPAGEERPRVAIETAERWCRGEATLDEVRAARGGAWDARAYATTAAYTAAAYAAATAAYATTAAAYATTAAYTAAAYAADADADADAAYAARRTLAPLVRAHIPLSVAVCAALGLRDPLPLRFDVEVAA